MFKPEEEEVLFAYIAVASHAVSLVLVRADNGAQKPVYYVSKSLHEAEVRYLPLEKAIFGNSARYAKASTLLPGTHGCGSNPTPPSITTSKNGLQREDCKVGDNSRSFDIKYMPRTSVKGQILANLVAKFAEPLLVENEERSGMDGKSVVMVVIQELPLWKVYVDGAANQRGSGVGLVIVSPERITIEKSLRLGFSATNNEVEYEALLVGMTMVQKMEGREMEIFSDLRLVVCQVKGELEARDVRM
ncbi:uncharacterized protein LOC142612036 [Castanea sativa]|uniref:uncharacterized protein LOC142612036 n=1 Tax=Castanea sativa TaxID=21020 RepID=UPI003F64AC22